MIQQPNQTTNQTIDQSVNQSKLLIHPLFSTSDRSSCRGAVESQSSKIESEERKSCVPTNCTCLCCIHHSKRYTSQAFFPPSLFLPCREIYVHLPGSLENVLFEYNLRCDMNADFHTFVASWSFRFFFVCWYFHSIGHRQIELKHKQQ